MHITIIPQLLAVKYQTVFHIFQQKLFALHDILKLQNTSPVYTLDFLKYYSDFLLPISSLQYYVKSNGFFLLASPRPNILICFW